MINLNILIITILLLVNIDIVIIFLIKPYLDKKNQLRELDLKNKQCELYIQISPQYAEEEINKLVKKYIDTYTLSEIYANNIIYLTHQDIDDMVRKLDKAIMLEISDLYVFYIKLLTNIDDEKDLLVYIDSKVKELVLEFVTEFNKNVPVE